MMVGFKTSITFSGLESQDIHRIASHRLRDKLVEAWSVPELEDSCWDAFLESTSLGHFQQSSLWARAKQTEGWDTVRVVVTLDEEMVGGFQILIRQSRFGKIGYIYKGPVLVSEESSVLTFLVEVIASTVRLNHLKAIIVQPPDQAVIDEALMRKYHLLPNHLLHVISATLLVDLSNGLDKIRDGIRKNTAIEIRQAERRGIKIRQGDERDLNVFFRLMLATCERQQTKPIPATESALHSVWSIFNKKGRIQLFLAEFEYDIVAGGLCFCFGERVTIWKKGWSGQHREKHPNQLLLFKIIEWAQQRGYKLFDFAALDPHIASALLHGNSLSENQKKSRDFIHLSFGDRPMLLPPSYIYIPNIVTRFIYRILTTNNGLKHFVKQFAYNKL
jgi:lipid II:glycine glycyltransferase (peptidoglycan interpeptide bridge formation enzyme)